MKRPRLDADLGREPRRYLTSRYRPAWADSTLLRRLLAVALAVLAGALLVRGDPGRHESAVVVAAHDLAPGRVLAAGDLRVAAFSAGTLPDGALHEVTPLLGATVSGAVHGGEILTDLRVVGSRLATAATGTPDARIVPIRLADNAVADILRTGDRVDVIAADEAAEGAHGPGPPRTLATDAVVVLIAGVGKSGRGSDDRVVLLALAAAHATAVAAASLRTALTVVCH
ncbi:Flp pilus assembly protein CpaB [Nocardia transvalensis]|uniref:Flp pilus assembly protein CpaB n=1 Tax=Nocardia transvalensis TaxID=37333 RepID=A0A7W9UIW6_9NOCA|nr:SAF domain-containing protein [Nocardia transvalensis]MBB5914642.1 Flp pilus assembly protein CpaB [Nocardia transvalensis]